MPPRQRVAAPSSQPIGNVIAAAPTREIKLPPFEEDMPQAWYNQAEAYFRLHGVTDRMFWFYYVNHFQTYRTVFLGAASSLLQKPKETFCDINITKQ